MHLLRPICSWAVRLTMLLITAAAFTTAAHATPITYTFVVADGLASGSLGTVTFSNAVVAFTFEGDTANVYSYSIPATPFPVTGAEILMGTASVVVEDLAGNVLAQGTFLPSAGIFVSVDNRNQGVGIGSFGVLPSSPNFPDPSNPLYPYGLAYVPALATYDLKSNISTGFGWTYSCAGFPAVACKTGVALATTSGDLILNPDGWSCCSTFTAELHPEIPFSTFDAALDREGSRFRMKSSFTLGTDSNGINPVTDAVTLQIGTYSVTLPPGSFRQSLTGGYYSFNGILGSAKLNVVIAPKGSDRYLMQVQGSGADFTGTTRPVSVQLTIGDDTGTTTATRLDD